jgi:hypothetical protein
MAHLNYSSTAMDFWKQCNLTAEERSSLPGSSEGVFSIEDLESFSSICASVSDQLPQIFELAEQLSQDPECSKLVTADVPLPMLFGVVLENLFKPAYLPKFKTIIDKIEQTLWKNESSISEEITAKLQSCTATPVPKYMALTSTIPQFEQPISYNAFFDWNSIDKRAIITRIDLIHAQ